jgi:hypothetical protein
MTLSCKCRAWPIFGERRRVGRLSVLSAYDGDIVDLALSASDTNAPFRLVLNFSQFEYAACMWGLMPGSITDETSPFNECSHAYLAAVKKELLDMRTMPAEAKRANELVSRIDEEMVLSGMVLIGCQFSNETFNTAEMIFPNWFNVPSHIPHPECACLVRISDRFGRRDLGRRQGVQKAYQARADARSRSCPDLGTPNYLAASRFPGSGEFARPELSFQNAALSLRC